ncbi:tRNA(His) guanylyltransferase 2-like isoform X1 [Chenopodium quinoa]|uniref:tRNA(His) guanylyltransferase 2-like isoform X1 n=2 Tax=Chenopodium quinoa TaxID=63459 RepID=UPI000B78784D|nr:tRNA(His) guanylyltransferase 2-like isoform X1 [Chenopodium quinoa]
MANSKYEYVKSFEVQDKIMLPTLIVVVIDGRNFGRFSEAHKFEKPRDRKALELMISCATVVMEEYADIIFSYGYSDEFSFVIKKESKFYQRRGSKILSLLVSFFTSVYTIKWKDFFPHQKLLYAPSFHAQIIRCPTLEVLQNYLAWRQNDCHLNNLYDTCFWKLVKSGKSESEAHGRLKGTQKQEKNELLFQEFLFNYKTLHPMLRQGTCLFKTQIEEVVKYKENGDPIKRLRRKIMEVHSDNIAGKSFWNQHSSLLSELGRFEEDIHKIRPEYVESFLFEDKLMLSTWIVVRIDGCHFHRFSDIHKFKKPNDEEALKLMNSCAAAVLEEFQDVTFAYGVSDEFSFVLKKDSKFYERQPSGIVSSMVSFFSTMYISKWNEFFPETELKYPPSFDGRAVCYPSSEILRDYLSWRQVDCHINNQYNTCFWMLVNSRKTKPEAQNYLKGTQTQEKNDLLAQNGIDYNTLPDIFRRGSCIFWDKENKTLMEVNYSEDSRKKIVIEHCNIIDDDFWDSHPWILGDKLPLDCANTRAMKRTLGQLED